MAVKGLIEGRSSVARGEAPDGRGGPVEKAKITSGDGVLVKIAEGRRRPILAVTV